MVKYILISFFSTLLLISGCSNQKMIAIVASENKLPSNFEEIAHKREVPPHHQYLVKRVVKQTDFKETWDDLFELEEVVPTVDFTTKDIIFLGVRESGSCPYKIGKTNIENEDMTISLISPNGACTTDAVPKTFVMELDKDISHKIKNLVIVEGDISTTVSIEGNE